MSSTEGTTAAVKDGRSEERESDNLYSELTTSLEFSPLAGDEWSSGTTLPLNSK